MDEGFQIKPEEVGEIPTGLDERSSTRLTEARKTYASVANEMLKTLVDGEEKIYRILKKPWPDQRRIDELRKRSLDKAKRSFAQLL